MISVLLALLILWLPESPYYLMVNGKILEAKQSLIWLRGDHFDPDEEILALKQTLEEQSSEQIRLKTLVTEGRYLKPFLISCALFFAMAWSGINAVFFYVQVIFIDSGADMDPGTYSI